MSRPKMPQALKHPETGAVIWLEAEPVLNLLERVEKTLPTRDPDGLAHEIYALLCSHGRLGEAA